MKQLRPYQKILSDATIDALTVHNRVVVSSPTGSGKTVIAVQGIIPHLPKPLLWVTHRWELATQVKDCSKGIDIAMISKADPKGYASIIIDEGHHTCAKTYASILSRAGNAKVVALTATPYRLDGQGMAAVGFSKIIIGDDILQLTNDGHLCPAEVFVPQSHGNNSWKPKATAKRVASHKFQQGIIYCRRVIDAHQTAAELLVEGIKAKAISGDTEKEEREKAIKDFKRGKIKVLCNHTVLTEGTDLPEVDLIVLNRATNSRCLWRQMIGRGLRVSNGKKFCTVLDLTSNSVLHGSIYDKEVYDLTGRVISTESRFYKSVTEIDPEENQHEYKNGEELKPWKPIPELKIIRRTLLTLNASLLKSKLLTDTSDY